MPRAVQRWILHGGGKGERGKKKKGKQQFWGFLCAFGSSRQKHFAMASPACAVRSARILLLVPMLGRLEPCLSLTFIILYQGSQFY